MQDAGADQLSFLANAQYRKFLATSQAGAVLLTHEDAQAFSGDALLVANPYQAYAQLSHLFDRKPVAAAGIHPTAVVAEDAFVDATASIGAYAVIESAASVGSGVTIGAHCVVGARSVIGEDGWLAPRVTLYHDVTIGKRVVIQSGAVIGGEGFGFANEKGVWKKIAQIGGVTLGDDVEIGANTTVDRGALADTLIGNGVKLDNQIMIAHNVQIGDNTAMAGCVGISGSTKVAENVVLGGQVGVVGHITIAKGSQVQAQSGINRSITEENKKWGGSPAFPFGNELRSQVLYSKLPELEKRIAELEKQLNDKNNS